jgi:hypothetical protein
MASSVARSRYSLASRSDSFSYSSRRDSERAFQPRASSSLTVFSSSSCMLGLASAQYSSNALGAFLGDLLPAAAPLVGFRCVVVRSAWECECEKASEEGERVFRFWAVRRLDAPREDDAAPGGGVSMLARSEALRCPRLIRSGFSLGCGSGRSELVSLFCLWYAQDGVSQEKWGNRVGAYCRWRTRASFRVLDVGAGPSLELLE